MKTDIQTLSSELQASLAHRHFPAAQELCHSLLQIGAGAEALHSLKAFLAEVPGSVAGHQLLAGLYQIVGETELAEYHLQLMSGLQEKYLQQEIAQAQGKLFPGYFADYCYHFDYFSLLIPFLQEYLIWQTPPQRILEIGAYEGLSTVWWMENQLAQGGEIRVIDPWLPYADLDPVERYLMAQIVEKNFDRNTQAAQAKTGVKLVKDKALSAEILPTLPRAHFDLVFVDGSHQAADVLQDMVWAWHCLKPGGYLLCDDYLWERNPDPAFKPKTAIDSFMICYQPQLKQVAQGWAVLLQKLPDPVI